MATDGGPLNPVVGLPDNSGGTAPDFHRLPSWCPTRAPESAAYVDPAGRKIKERLLEDALLIHKLQDATVTQVNASGVIGGDDEGGLAGLCRRATPRLVRIDDRPSIRAVFTSE